jgi:hypothetical protein
VKLDQLSKEEFHKQTEIEKDLINFNVWDIAFKIAYKKAEENIKSSKTYNKGIQKYEKAILQNKSLEEKYLNEVSSLYYSKNRQLLDKQTEAACLKFRREVINFYRYQL